MEFYIYSDIFGIKNGIVIDFKFWANWLTKQLYFLLIDLLTKKLRKKMGW